MRSFIRRLVRLVVFIPWLIAFTGRIALSQGPLPELLNFQPLPDQIAPVNPQLQLGFQIEFPADRQLNTKAPSYLKVFESLKGEWLENSTVDLRSLPVQKRKLTFDNTVRLESDSGPIIFDLVVYHCSEGPSATCSVTSYRGKVVRQPMDVGNPILNRVIKIPNK